MAAFRTELLKSFNLFEIFFISSSINSKQFFFSKLKDFPEKKEIFIFSFVIFFSLIFNFSIILLEIFSFSFSFDNSSALLIKNKQVLINFDCMELINLFLSLQYWLTILVTLKSSSIVVGSFIYIQQFVN